jgi:hypothetical protein
MELSCLDLMCSRTTIETFWRIITKPALAPSSWRRREPVAKATVLICDHCKVHTASTVTLVLADVCDSKSGVQRDLCGRHATKVLRSFGWKWNHTEEPKPKKRKMLGPSPLRGRTKVKWNLTDAEQFVKEHDSFTAVDLAKHLHLHKAWVNVRIVPELVKLGIIRIEGKGRARRLARF